MKQEAHAKSKALALGTSLHYSRKKYMTGLGDLATPERIEKREEYRKFPLFYFGIVTAIDTDIEGLNRVRVKIDELAGDIAIPGGEEGFDVIVAEEFVCNGKQGGATRFIEPGVQVMVQPRFMGSLIDAIVTWCIPSRIDPPSPALNRANRQWGLQTPGETIQAFDDHDGSSIDARPNGCCDRVNGNGDRTIQTEEGATAHLSRDGTVQMQNPQGSTTIAPDGTIESRNANQATSTLNADGTIMMKAQSQAAFGLAQAAASLTGPPGDVALLVRQVESMLGGIGEARTLIIQIEDSIEGVETNRDDAYTFYRTISPWLIKLDDIVQTNFDKIKEAIEKIKALPEHEIVNAAVNQAEQFREGGLSAIARAAKAAIDNAEIESNALVLEEVKKVSSDRVAERLGPELVRILDSLQGQPDIQLQAILEAVAPGQFGGIKSIVGMNLHTAIDMVDNLFDIDIPEWINKSLAPTEEQIQQWTSQLGELIGQLQSLIPKEFMDFFGHDTLNDIIGSVLGGQSDPLGAIFGRIVGGLSDRVIEPTEEAIAIKPDIEKYKEIAVQLLADPTSQVDLPEKLDEQGNPVPIELNLAEELKKALLKLAPLLEKIAEDGNKIIDSMDTSEPGGTLTATKDMLESRMASSTHTTTANAIATHLVQRLQGEITRETTVTATHEDVTTEVLNAPRPDRTTGERDRAPTETTRTSTSASGITQAITRAAAGAVENVEEVTTAMTAEGMESHIKKIVAGVVEETLTKMTIDSIESKVKNAVIKIAEQYIQAQVGDGPVPKMFINAAKAALQSPGAEVFASLGGNAGVATPWGAFSLGSGGGNMISQGLLSLASQESIALFGQKATSLLTDGLMSMQVPQNINPLISQALSAGLASYPGRGVELASWTDALFNQEDDPTDRTHQTARVGVDNGEVHLDYQAIYFNGRNVTTKLEELLSSSSSSGT